MSTNGVNGVPPGSRARAAVLSVGLCLGLCAGTLGCNSGEAPDPEREVEAPGQPNAAARAEAAKTAQPVEPQDFCSSAALIRCTGIQNCCSDDERKYVDRGTCLEESTRGCDTQMAASPGFDAQAAGIELELLKRTIAECSIPYEIDYAALFPAEADAISATGEECAEGQIWAFVDAAFRFECVTPLDLGAECKVGNCKDEHVCLPRVVFDDTVPTCQERSQQGEACEPGACATDSFCFWSETDSASGVVASTPGVCTSAQPDGSDCSEDYHCVSSFCNRDFDGLGASGECGSCTSHDQCGIVGLVLEVCLEGICTGAEDVVGVFEDGAACRTDENCKSGWCEADVCITPTPDELYCLKK